LCKKNGLLAGKAVSSFENGARVCDPQGRGKEKRLLFAMTL
jgi:hypothetical protein